MDRAGWPTTRYRQEKVGISFRPSARDRPQVVFLFDAQSEERADAFCLNIAEGEERGGETEVCGSQYS